MVIPKLFLSELAGPVARYHNSVVVPVPLRCRQSACSSSQGCEVLCRPPRVPLECTERKNHGSWDF